MMTDIEIGERIAAIEILSYIEQVYFSERFKDFRVARGSNGQRDLIINFIKEHYLKWYLERSN